MVYKILKGEEVVACCPLSHEVCNEQCALLVPFIDGFICALSAPIDTEQPIPWLIIKEQGRSL